ncbi:MAG TPA: TetR/AcrR family transcriptional regulator [Thermoanaerobaculia bacterium]|nr:TetR/AcrR family transcriptional regulator [Thermoanaerobaculia bacterium]
MTVHSSDTETFRGTGKRERILRAAVEVFARRGYFNAKVAEIARVAGVADGTIYLYFQGKEDLLITIFREHMKDYLKRLETNLEGERTAVEQIRRIIAFHLDALGRDRSLAVVFQVELRQSVKFMSELSHEGVTEYLVILKHVVERGQAAGEFRADLQPQLIANSIFGVLDEMVTRWILSEKEYALSDHSEGISDFILRGLAG